MRRHRRTLRRRTAADLEAARVALRLATTAPRIAVRGRKPPVPGRGGADELISYDKLIVGTGAVPVQPPIAGLTGPGALGPEDGVHALHTMSDTFAIMGMFQEASPTSAVIIGAGYLGPEMVDPPLARGLAVTQ